MASSPLKDMSSRTLKLQELSKYGSHYNFYLSQIPRRWPSNTLSSMGEDYDYDDPDIHPHGYFYEALRSYNGGYDYDELHILGITEHHYQHYHKIFDVVVTGNWRPRRRGRPKGVRWHKRASYLQMKDSEMD